MVWPMYDFENAIEDRVSTHVLRSAEFGKMRIELQDYIRSKFNMKSPVTRHYGRFTNSGGIGQGREIREMIEKGEVFGWDDPRLITLKALRRRGIQREVCKPICCSCKRVC